MMLRFITHAIIVRPSKEPAEENTYSCVVRDLRRTFCHSGGDDPACGCGRLPWWLRDLAGRPCGWSAHGVATPAVQRPHSERCRRRSGRSPARRCIGADRNPTRAEPWIGLGERQETNGNLISPPKPSRRWPWPDQVAGSYPARARSSPGTRPACLQRSK